MDQAIIDRDNQRADYVRRQRERDLYIRRAAAYVGSSSIGRAFVLAIHRLWCVCQSICWSPNWQYSLCFLPPAVLAICFYGFAYHICSLYYLLQMDLETILHPS